MHLFPLSESKFETDGLVVFHNQRCSIYQDEYAVYNCNEGYFEPSWKAQSNGYKLIKIDNFVKKLLYKLFFKGS